MPKIQCSVTGLWYAVTTNHKRELVEKFEREGRTLEKDYVSRDARRLRKEGKSDVEIRQLAETGELGTKTVAPKRARKSSKAGTVATPRKATKVDKTETASNVPVDPEVSGFMDGQAPAVEGTGKAV